MISKNLSMKNNSKKKKFVFLGDTDSINIEIIVRSHNYLRNKVKYIVIGNKLELEKYLKRLKTNINRIGYSNSKIPIYSFNYKNDLKTTYKGVMAQNLLEMGFNNSVILDSNGFYAVDYSSIDVDMEII